jgi:hypothetical protein
MLFDTQRSRKIEAGRQWNGEQNGPQPAEIEGEAQEVTIHKMPFLKGIRR